MPEHDDLSALLSAASTRGDLAGPDELVARLRRTGRRRMPLALASLAIVLIGVAGLVFATRRADRSDSSPSQSEVVASTPATPEPTSTTTTSTILGAPPDETVEIDDAVTFSLGGLDYLVDCTLITDEAVGSQLDTVDWLGVELNAAELRDVARTQAIAVFGPIAGCQPDGQPEQPPTPRWRLAFVHPIDRNDLNAALEVLGPSIQN